MENGEGGCLVEDNQLNKEPKKILMVHNFYQIGGGEHTVFTNEVKLLRDHGHEVVEYTRSNDELKDSKIKLLLSPFSTIWSFKTYREVKRIIKEQHIDIVHCHNTFPLISPSVYYAARKCGVPVVQTIHNFRFLCPNGTFFCDGKICEKCKEKNSFKDALKNRCYRDSKIQTFIVVAMLKIHRALGTYKKINYIFLTDFNKEKFSGLIDINGGNVFVKPNFVNEERKVGHSIKDKMFIYAGRLEENKGVRLILQRWDLLPDKYHLRIYGDGELKNYVESVAATHRNIEYFGFQPQQVIFEDLATASALVFPSIWYEGFPMIIAESLSIGCPVLATNIGNHADVIKESDGGVLFDPDDVEGFEKSVDKIIKENQKLSVNARRYFTEHLNKTTNCLHLQNIYDAAEIVGGGGGYEENKELVFIFMGRLEDNKGIVSLINMWKMIPGNYVLHIYGEGTHHDFVEEVCNSNDNIKYYGFQIHDVIFEDMRRAIAVIIPSEWYEPFGMSIPESFSKGIPVISTNLGNPGAMIEKSRAGATYKVDDYISFKQAIDTVVRNRAECSINALAYYRTHLCSEVNYIASESNYNAAEIGGGTAK